MKNNHTNVTTEQKKERLGWIMGLYLLGLFIGALSTGIITPARTIIQAGLKVDDTTGIWMITIYTLSYAAIIPIAGKMADKLGRKIIYVFSMALFGIGSVICGLSPMAGSFGVLLLGRVVQAIGAGGIMPIATAEFGTGFPEEKRGMALGMVGGVYGIANVLGATAGSAILDIFGPTEWQWIFFINVPFCLFILVGSIIFIPNNKAVLTAKIDKLGTLLMVLIILSLLYGLKNINFFNFLPSLASTKVWPFLLVVVALIPFFVLVERRAEDPIFHMEYLGNRQIVITLILGLLVGASMMGMIFIPQFAENSLKMASGSGGYFVIILGLCAGIAAPTSGRLIDKFGAKPILGAGFLTSIVGCLYLALVATNFNNPINVAISLILIGFGMGLTMGTPLNYMMLDNTHDEESNSALATLSLVRSIGTAVAPAIMVGFIVNAAGGMQSNIMDILPKEINMPPLPYAEEIDAAMDKYSNDPKMKEQFAGMDIPDLTAMQTVEINMKGDGNYKMPKDMLALMQGSDVTTIADNTKVMVNRMFSEMTPGLIANIDTGVGKGLDGISIAIGQVSAAKSEMENGYNGLGKGISGMSEAVAAQRNAKAQLSAAAAMMSKAGGSPAMMPSSTMTLVDFLPPAAKESMPKETLESLKQVRSLDDLNAKIGELDASIATLSEKIVSSSVSQKKMGAALIEIKKSEAELQELQQEMQVLKAAIPETFDAAGQLYIAEVDKKSGAIEDVFQSTLNKGFRNMYLCVGSFNVIALLILMFYGSDRKKNRVTS